MRSASALVALVREIVDEPTAGVSNTAILASINEALNHVAETLTPTTLLVPFEQVDIFSGDTYFELSALSFPALPHKILSVFNSDKRPVKIHRRAVDAEIEFAKDLSQSKNPAAVLISNNAVYLIPGVNENTEMYVSYFRKPELFEDMDDDGSEITFVPEGLGEKVVLNYAAAMAYRKIEDGVTDGNENFKLYTSLYTLALKELEQFYGPEAKQLRPELVSGAREITGAFQAGGLFP